MVGIFSATEQATIKETIAQAETKTSAEIAVLIAPVSDHYQNFWFFYGFVISCVVMLGLWFGRMTHNLLLLVLVQTTILALFAWLPWLDHLVSRLIPKNIRTHHTAMRANAEFVALSHRIKANTPIVLIYLSIAERAIHILPSQNVREVLGDEVWAEHAKDIGLSVRNHGLAKACVRMIDNVAMQLMPYFPNQGESNALPNEVQQLKR